MTRQRRHKGILEHVVMYREVSPPYSWPPLIQPVCTCDWEGQSHVRFIDADAEGDSHLKRYEHFPRLITPD